MSKVKVSKEVADVIEFYKAKSDNWYDQVLIDVLKSKEGFTSESEAIVLDNNFTMMELAVLLLNGYEIELTPKEKVEVTYQSMAHNHIVYLEKGDKDNASYLEGYIRAMKEMNVMLKLNLNLKS